MHASSVAAGACATAMPHGPTATSPSMHARQACASSTNSCRVFCAPHGVGIATAHADASCIRHGNISPVWHRLFEGLVGVRGDSMERSPCANCDRIRKSPAAVLSGADMPFFRRSCMRGSQRSLLSGQMCTSEYRSDSQPAHCPHFFFSVCVCQTAA